MDKENYMTKEHFLSTANASGLFLEEPYREKLFTWVKNMSYANRVIYDIDVSSVEPVSIVSCLKEARK